MKTGIFRPRQQVQRITPNAGNRTVIAGGRGLGRPRPPAQPKPGSLTAAVFEQLQQLAGEGGK